MEEHEVTRDSIINKDQSFKWRSIFIKYNMNTSLVKNSDFSTHNSNYF